MIKEITHEQAKLILANSNKIGIKNKTLLYEYISQQEKQEIEHKERKELFDKYFYISVSMSKKGVEKISIMPYEEKVKQEKLLELYKELVNVWKNRYDYNNSVDLIKSLEKQIKELEKDEQ